MSGFEMLKISSAWVDGNNTGARRPEKAAQVLRCIASGRCIFPHVARTAMLANRMIRTGRIRCRAVSVGHRVIGAGLLVSPVDLDAVGRPSDERGMRFPE